VAGYQQGPSSSTSSEALGTQRKNTARFFREPRVCAPLSSVNILGMCTGSLNFISLELQPGVVNFGDVDVGRTKTTDLFILNKSDLPAKVQFKFMSKIVSATHDELTIPPRQSVPVTLEIAPRKVGLLYQ